MGEDAHARLRALIQKVSYGSDRLVIHLDRQAVDAALGAVQDDGASAGPIIVEQLCTLARRGKAQRLMIANASLRLPSPDPALATAILRAREWFEKLVTRQVASIADLAAADGHTRAWVSQQLPLALLAPDIVEAVAAGRQPTNWTVERLVAAATASPDWTEQRAALC